MVRIWIVTVVCVVALVPSLGCAQQGAGNAPSDSTQQTTTSLGVSSERPTTTAEETVLHGLECPSGMAVSGYIDYVMGAKGKKGTPVEVARREFSKKIEEGDTVEIAERSRGQNAKASVRVIREGRVVARIEYRRVGGGWLQDYYEACTDF
jgi:hypothetical protein